MRLGRQYHDSHELDVKKPTWKTKQKDTSLPLLDVPCAIISSELYNIFNQWFNEVHNRAVKYVSGRAAEVWDSWKTGLCVINENNFKHGNGCYDTIIKPNIQSALELVQGIEYNMNDNLPETKRQYMAQRLKKLIMSLDEDVNKMLIRYSVKGKPAIEVYSKRRQPTQDAAQSCPRRL